MAKPINENLRDVRVETEAGDLPMVGDLAMLVARLARKLRKAAPADELPAQALDYLNRNGLKGSPLREVGAGETAVQGDMLLPANAEVTGGPLAARPVD